MRARHLFGAAAFLGLLSSTSLADTVDNPGDVTITVLANSSVKIGNQDPITFGGGDPPSTLVATAGSDGSLVIPQASINFQPMTVNFSGIPITAHLVPTADGSGTLNPLTGDTTAQLSLKVTLSGSVLPQGCEIPNVTVNLDAANDGGSPYESTGGTASLVDNTFAAPAAQNCGVFTALINQQLGLPSASGNNNILLNIAVNPILSGS